MRVLAAVMLAMVLAVPAAAQAPDPGSQRRAFEACEPGKGDRKQLRQFRREIRKLTNEARLAHDLPKLNLRGRLNRVAQNHAEDMERMGRMSHKGSDGSTVDRRARRAEYLFREILENVAVGQGTPEEVMRDWMNSPRHRNTILAPRVKDLGVGFVKGRSGRAFPSIELKPGCYWVMVVGRSSTDRR